MKSRLSLLLAIAPLCFAGTGHKLVVGSTASVIEGIEKQQLRATSTYTIPVSTGAEVKVNLEDFYHQDGQLSMFGRAIGSEESSFVLKGDRKDLYGWVVLHDKNEAYEYTTDKDGIVVVESVPVSKICSVDELPDPSIDWASIIKVPEFNFYNSAAYPAHIGKYPGTNVNKLQSLPGARKVMYLDITRVMNGDTPKSQTKEDVWITWQCVATAFAPFQLNVTTDASVYQAAGVSNSGILRCLDTEGRSFAYVNSFGSSQFATIYRTMQGAKVGGYSTGRTAAHEAGHVIAMADSGQGSETYFVGFPKWKWVPLMGNFWKADAWGEEGFVQWAKGDYENANSAAKTDFLAVTSGKAPFREDDIPGTAALKVKGGKVSQEENFGQISKTGDSDDFTFEIKEKGHIKLKINRIELMSMLDIDASILDASGKALAQNSPTAARYASFDMDLQPGKYTLRIKGGAEGTPKNGFSNYGSLGFYGIEGEVTGAAN